jgi:hypothetical protein
MPRLIPRRSRLLKSGIKKLAYLIVESIISENRSLGQFSGATGYSYLNKKTE